MDVVGRVRRSRQLGQGRFIARPGCGANPAAGLREAVDVVGRVRRSRQLGQGRFIARPGCGANPAARAYGKLGTL
ncbi:hypothetical protein [Raoultella planticola]|uniref:hypothetical protein n=1 Tax=Raoultella planticola TaxID=575 RepID=UPI00384C9000